MEKSLAVMMVGRGLVVLFALFLTVCGSASASHDRNVLFISSYHPAFHSFMDQVEGLKEGLHSAGHEASEAALNIEFMDTKRFPDAKNLASFRDRLVMKLRGLPVPDVVVVADDNAFEFALSERDGLFANLPIVFLGVNNLERAMAQNADPRITGVVEKPSIEETLAFAETLLSPDGAVHAIVDDTVTGRLNREILEASPTFEALGGRVRIVSLGTLSFTELGETLATIEPGSVVLLITAFRDREGTVLLSREAADLIVRNARVPFLHPWEPTLGYGSLGGVVISHREQGRTAGRLASAILSGRDPASLPVVGESPNVLTLDHDVMKAFGLGMDDVPSGSRILNAPLNLYQEYRAWIWGAGLFIVLQTGVILVLTTLYRQRRHAEEKHRISQEKFRDFAGISSDWFWEMDENLRFSYFSDRFEEITGVPKSALLGRTREETGIPNVDPAAWQDHLDTLHAHRPFRDFIHPREADGETIWVSINGKPQFDENGAFKGYRGTGRNITKWIRAEEALASALTAAEAANQSKSEFLATMSHELRTPLNAILGFSDMLQHEFFGPLGDLRYKEYVRDIHDSGAHLKSLVNDILDISAIEAGKRSIEIERVAVSEMLNDCVRNMTASAQSGGVSLQIDTAVNLPAVFADRRMLVQIVLNLLSNAVKFTPSGGTVTAAARSDGTAVEIAIADTGIGIAANRLDRITEPFSQTLSNPHITQQGTGRAFPS